MTPKKNQDYCNIFPKTGSTVEFISLSLWNTSLRCAWVRRRTHGSLEPQSGNIFMTKIWSQLAVLQVKPLKKYYFCLWGVGYFEKKANYDGWRGRFCLWNFDFEICNGSGTNNSRIFHMRYIEHVDNISVREFMLLVRGKVETAL